MKAAHRGTRKTAQGGIKISGDGGGKKQKKMSPKGERAAADGSRTQQKKGKFIMSKSSGTIGASIHQIHDFSLQDGRNFTEVLLKWYENTKRDLPWRSLSPQLSHADRAYAVLVSEVMLQQTQVITVIQYYSKWMARWPTFGDLAGASLDEVNKVWAGMGYYSRAKRLWEAASKVSGELCGEVPLTSKELQEKLPGVGRYTAGAVASIVFGEKVPAVDGNVIRVLSRVRCLGGDSTSKAVLDHVWKLSDQIVSEELPGNFNQAMMDLGATICTPKKPACNMCPVSHLCLAYQHVLKFNPLKELQNAKPSEDSIEDIENVPCHLCLPEPWDHSLGVMNFPRKSKKAPPRKEVTLVCIVYKNEVKSSTEFLLSQRPQGGLLAGLWEFPSLVLSGPRSEDLEEEVIILKNELLLDLWGVNENSISPPSFIAAVPHIFSHIHQLYVIYSVELLSVDQSCKKEGVETQWMSSSEVTSSAISTAMKKVFSAFYEKDSKSKVQTKKRQRSSTKLSPEMSAKKMTDFFHRLEKK